LNATWTAERDHNARRGRSLCAPIPGLHRRRLWVWHRARVRPGRSRGVAESPRSLPGQRQPDGRHGWISIPPGATWSPSRLAGRREFVAAVDAEARASAPPL